MEEHNLNVNQWCILDIISVAPSWCEIVMYRENPYFWISRKKILEELKALDLKEDTIYRHLKTLKELGFIDYEKDQKKDLIKLTDLGKSLFISSEINPTKLGNKSEKNSEINPTYNNTNIINNTKDNKSDFELPIYITKERWEEWVKFRRQLKKPLTDLSIQKQIKFLSECQAKGQNPNLIIEQSIQNGWTGLFELKKVNSLLDRCINENSRTYEINEEEPF